MNNPERDQALTHEWRRWAAETLMVGAVVADVIAVMVAEGIPEPLAAAACAEICLDPIFDAGRSIAHQHRKLKSVLGMQRAMLALLPQKGHAVDRRSGLSREEFLSTYYARNQPVILEDVCNDWPACGVWSPAYLEKTLGDEPVEVMAGRAADPDYEVNAGSHRRLMVFSAFVELMTSVTSSNDTYLVANNRLLQRPAAAPLWRDFELDPRYFCSERNGQTFVWVGGAGTITPLHHDLMNVMFHQICGRKRFTLIAPTETPYVYNSRGVFSDVDPLAPELERYPEYAEAHPIHVELGPGEALLIPAGWWHHVEALTMSISLSAGGFVYENSVEWFSPERVE